MPSTISYILTSAWHGLIDTTISEVPCRCCMQCCWVSAQCPLRSEYLPQTLQMHFTSCITCQPYSLKHSTCLRESYFKNYVPYIIKRDCKPRHQIEGKCLGFATSQRDLFIESTTCFISTCQSLNFRIWDHDQQFQIGIFEDINWVASRARLMHIFAHMSGRVTGHSSHRPPR